MLIIIPLLQMGKKCKQGQIFFAWAPKSLHFKFQGDCSMELKDICSEKKL